MPFVAYAMVDKLFSVLQSQSDKTNNVNEVPRQKVATRGAGHESTKQEFDSLDEDGRREKL